FEMSGAIIPVHTLTAQSGKTALRNLVDRCRVMSRNIDRDHGTPRRLIDELYHRITISVVLDGKLAVPNIRQISQDRSVLKRLRWTCRGFQWRKRQSRRIWRR